MSMLHSFRSLSIALCTLLLTLNTSIAQIAEIEPNNTPTTAQIMTFGVDYLGKLSSGTPADTVDYFRFSVTSAGNLNLTMKPQTAAGSANDRWKVRVWDYATGKEMLGFYVNTLNPAGAPTSLGLATGDYYIGIEAYVGNVTNVPYLLTATLTVGTTYEQEFNDSAGAAQQINFGTEYLGRLQSRLATSTTEADFYKFSLTSPGNITLRFKPQTTGGSTFDRWRVRLWDYATGKDLLGLYVNTFDPVGGVISVGLVAGNYYVSVEDYLGNIVNVPYSLSATLAAGTNFEQEFNDSAGTAQAILLGTEYLGSLQNRISSSTTESDYYKFGLTSPGNITLRFKPQITGGSTFDRWRVRLWDYSSGKDLLGLYVNTFDPVGGVISVGLMAGNYYISVEDYLGNVINVPYVLSVTLATGNNFEQEFNDSAGTAQAINLGTEYLGSLQNRISSSTTESDYYKFSLTSPGNITLRFKPQITGGSTFDRWRVRLWDYSTGKELLGIYVDTLNPAGVTTSVGLTTGSYYISIEDYLGNVVNVPYLLIATLTSGNNFEQEFNDAPGTAQPINFSTEYLGGLQSRISSSTTEFDYYKFGLSSAGSIAVMFKPQTAVNVTNDVWRIRLWDYATGGEIFRVNVSRAIASGQTVLQNLPAGNYYISVEASSGNVINVPYALSVTPSVPMVEFLHTALNYYFVTASPTEIAALDNFPAFVRTGESFPVYPSTVIGTQGVTRFYFDRVAVNATRGSHFYTLVDAEIAALNSLNPGNAAAPRLPFSEGVNSFAYVPVVSGIGGQCAAGQRPVYRVFRGNVRFPDDPNHRFTTNLAIYNNFVALGWDGEGVKFCVPMA